MKWKFITLGLALILAVSLAACAPAPTKPANAHIVVDCDSFMNRKHITGEIEIAADGKLTVVLCSNPTTGFSWSESAAIDDTSVIKQVNHEFIGPDSDPPPPPGTPGQEVWTFEASKAGKIAVYMEYSRPWEGGEKAEWTYTLTVTAR